MDKSRIRKMLIKVWEWAGDELVTPSDQVAISQASLGALLHKNTYITLLSSVCGKPSKITQNINSFNTKNFCLNSIFLREHWANAKKAIRSTINSLRGDILKYILDKLKHMKASIKLGEILTNFNGKLRKAYKCDEWCWQCTVHIIKTRSLDEGAAWKRSSKEQEKRWLYPFWMLLKF